MSSNTSSLTVDSISIEDVDQFCYLGSIIGWVGGPDADVQSFMDKARQASQYLQAQQTSHLQHKRQNSSLLQRNMESYGPNILKTLGPPQQMYETDYEDLIAKPNL